MKKRNNQLLMVLSAVGLMTFTACTDDKYDLGDLDTTIGVGSDEGLTLPMSSTKEILLDDLLELNNNESVFIKENGDYVFKQSSGDVAPVHPTIDKIAVIDQGSAEFPVVLDVDLPADLTPLVGEIIAGTANEIPSAVIYTLEYRGEKPAEINSLETVNTEGRFSVNINFSESLSRFIPNFKSFQIEFPSYMEIGLPQEFATEFEVKGHVLQAKNGVSTRKGLNLDVNITKLTFDGNELKMDDDQIVMEGSVKVAMAWDDIVVGSATLGELRLDSKLEIENLAIVGATGSFSPKIELNDLGSVTIGALPDFLTNENVNVDLYNPQIVVSIKSDLSVPGYLEGTLVAHKKDGLNVAVNIPKVKINAAEENGGVSHIMICRRNENIPDTITDMAVVDDLSAIIEALPYVNTISFNAIAGATPVSGSQIELGKAYTVKPSYSIEAPIAFAENARIVYSDKLDGWNDDIQDYEFADEAYLRVTADIENRIPAYLTMAAHAINLSGNKIDNLTVTVDSDIDASQDGNETKTTPIGITIRQKAPSALKAVDGIVFTIEAAAAADGKSPVEGVTLNAYNHSLLAKNIKITLVGKLVIKSDD